MNVYFSLATQFENLGDEMINTLLLREVSKRCRLVLFAGSAPNWYVKSVTREINEVGHRVDIIHDKTKYIRQLMLAGCFSPGTTILLSCGDVSAKGSSSRKSLVMNFLSRLPFLTFAQVGASRLAIHDTDVPWLKRTSIRSGKISVRDRYSKAELAKHDIRADLVPDLAFLMQCSPSPAGRRVVIMLREPGNNQDEFSKLIAQIVGKLKAEGYNPEFAWQVDRDSDFNRKLATMTNCDILYIPGAGQDRKSEALDSYSNAPYIISNRLHGLLIAASQGAIPIALLDDRERKVRGVLEHAELGDLILSTDTDYEETFDKLTAILKSRDVYQSHVANAFNTEGRHICSALDQYFGKSSA
ncbi:polysaccharide pyruvyl transferase family protein [Salipiger mucosus]|uniref:polysaccharide pyruvyl transferase family protein n=1 Tax=Salipiger mucosus TaxID=263378 RepID=UPI0009FF6074|nr:polysaccharide pyruvyl transferase family protein [Salipiger mucosus]